MLLRLDHQKMTQNNNDPFSAGIFNPKYQFLAQKSDLCHTTPIFVDDPFLALDMTINFPPWKQFFDFPFRSYSCFRKKIRLTAQKVFPPPTVGAPSASNSPSALSARAGKLLEEQTIWCEGRQI